jgi:hypothetical protein
MCWKNSEYNNRTARNQPQHGGGGANSGSICIPTDLGTYKNFIKPVTNFNSVLYPLHGRFIGKTRNIITGRQLISRSAAAVSKASAYVF